MSTRGKVEALALGAGVLTCSAPDLGRMEALGLMCGLVVAFCLLRLARRGEGDAAIAASKPPASESAESANVPGEWKRVAHRIESNPDFHKFASDGEDETESEHTSDGLALRIEDEDELTSIKPFARPVKTLAPTGVPEGKRAVAPASELKRLLNDLGMGSLEAELTAWGAKTPQDLKYMEESDFAELGLTKSQGRLLQRRAQASAFEP